jgi:Apea-like HEPN
MRLNMGGESFSVAVFPFLKTSMPAKLGGFVFRNTADTSGLTPEQAKAVSEIAAMLFLMNDLRIASASYAITPFVNLDHRDSDTSMLQRVQSIIAYLYGSPHPTMDSTGAFIDTSIVLFTPSSVSRFLVDPEFHVTNVDASRDDATAVAQHMEGYAGLYNFEHYFWVALGSRVYGPDPHPTLNMAQDLGADLERAGHSRAMHLLLGVLERPADQSGQRTLTAIRWYNSANREAANDLISIVHLAIAFEALFGLPPADKSDRLVDSIALLLGRVPRLDVWARQFYDARSQVAHEGLSESLAFIATDSLRQPEGPLYMSLLGYGRAIFRLCVSTLLFGADLSREAGLAERFVTNGERFQSLVRIFDDKRHESSSARLEASLPVIEAIKRYRFVGESGLSLEVMVGALRRVAAAVSGEMADLPTDVAEATRAMANTKRDDEVFDQLERIRALHDALAAAKEALQAPAIKGLQSLVESVWHYTFLHYFALEKQRLKANTEA